MPINYQTGVASSPLDLLNKLVTFATAHGWTTTVPTSGNVVLNNGDVHVGIDVDTTKWRANGCQSASSAAPWNAQPNASAFILDTEFGAGPFTKYHFYCDAEDGNPYAHVTLEMTAGLFRSWCIGALVKSGSWAGGTYVDSTAHDVTSFLMNQPEYSGHRSICDATHQAPGGNLGAHLWVDYDLKSDNWQLINGATPPIDPDQCTGSNRVEGLQGAMVSAIGDMAWNLRTPLRPAIYFANRGASLRSPIGRIPNFRLVSMRNFVDEQLVTYGSRTWQVFCMTKRWGSAAPEGEFSSGLYGFAHLR
jgi:hypothetical protein